MARFIGFIHGQAGEASRLGSPRSGITAEARGWNVGVKVHGRAEGDDDVFDVWADGGSNGYAPSRHLGTVRLVDGVPRFTVSDSYKVDSSAGLPFKVVV